MGKTYKIDSDGLHTLISDKEFERRDRKRFWIKALVVVVCLMYAVATIVLIRLLIGPLW